MGQDSENSGKAKGGKALAAKLTAEQKTAKAMKMVEAKSARKAMPRVTHEGVIKLVGVEIPCYVLSNGDRVLSQRGISEAFTGSRGGGGVVTGENGTQKTPRFLARKAIQPFVSKDLTARLNSPIEFLPKAGRSAFGYVDSLLPEICEVVIDSCRANGLADSQQYKVADTLIRGFARVGIAALIDEATGYQKDRARDALAQILEAYVAKELQPYIRTFDPEYYENMFRLRGLKYPPDSTVVKPQYRPQYFGKLTNEVVYKRLAPGILEALKEESKKETKKTHLHRFLTAGYGKIELVKHLARITMLMEQSQDWQMFMEKLNKKFPRYGDTLPLDLEENDR